MINSLKVKRKDGEIIEIKLRELKLSDINKIIKLQELIKMALKIRSYMQVQNKKNLKNT